MSLRPLCPEHGDDARLLALGEIDGARAERASRAVSAPASSPAETGGCAACGGWWRQNLELDAVAEGVAAGLDGLRGRRLLVPGRARRARGTSRIAAAAAALVLLVGGSLAWRLAGSHAAMPAMPAIPAAPAVASTNLARPTAERAHATLFADGMESGDLRAWTTPISSN